MNPQETEQVVGRDEGWVPAAERVKISPMNVRLETTVKPKEETFQVVIDVIKNSTCFKAFIISADVPEILMQQFWHTITKILDICPRKECEDFTEVPNDEDALTFLVGLGYSGPLHKYTNMFVDHMHQPWRTLAACINKCLSGKTASNDKLRKSRIDILLKFVRIGEVVQQYGLAIPATMLNIDIIESESYQKFLLYSTGSIPPKKSRGKGSQGKKTRGTTKETIEVTKEFDPEPLIRKKTSRRRVTRKEATILAADNIIPDLDIALELGKSISLTEAEEEAAAREVHATHEKIMSEAVLEPTRRRQIGVTIRDTSKAAGIMKALKKSRKTSKRQSITGGSDEGTGEIPGVLDESTVVFTTLSEGIGTKPGVPDEEEIIYEEGADETRKHSDRDVDAQDDDEETEYDYEDIYKYKNKVHKDADVEMKDAETVKEKEELTDVEKTAELIKEITEQTLTSPSLYVSSDYGTQFLNLSQDEETSEKPPVTSTTSELQQTTSIPTTIPTPPINTEAPSIPEITPLIASQVPTMVDKYLGTKLNDALLKALERHTADLIKKYSRLPAPESSKKQESKKNTKEIIRIKREQDEKKQMETYTIKSTDKATLKEFDLKNALFKAMHKNKKHDSDDDDDDDEGHSAGPNQGKPSKKRRTRESESAKKPSITKETSKGKAPKKDSKTGKSAPAEEPVEEPTKEVSMDEQTTEDIPSPDDMHVSVSEDTDNAHIPKFQMEECYKLLIDHVDLVNPEGHRIVPDISKTLPLGGPSGYNYLNEIVLRRADYNEYKLSEMDFKNLHPNYFEVLNILHLQGKLDHLPKQDKVHLYTAVNLWTRNIVIRKRVEDLQLGIESYQTKLNLEQPNWVASDFLFKEDYTIVYKPRAVIYIDRNEHNKMMRINEVYKFNDGTLTRIRDKLDLMVKDFKLFEYNKGMESRIWYEDDKRRSEEFIKVIEKRLKIRRIFRSLECFIGGRLRDIDYRLITRTE
nr:hypothetical protein [Tanacetum cinerariifolium]